MHIKLTDRGPWALVAATAMFLPGEAWADCVEPEPADYRMSHFRAPTPCALSGGTLISTEQAQQMHARAGVLFIDVLPAARRPAQFPVDSLWKPKSRSNIPGSTWLANSGFGVLPVEEEESFRFHLDRLTGGDNTRTLVIYCLADCWMSWNAARRAVEWGYRAVHWYPQGTDGWAAAGFALEKNSPLPLAGESSAAAGFGSCILLRSTSSIPGLA